MNKKKRHVFIVTWYKSENYGTCLQAYATYTVLSKECDVLFLNRRTYYSSSKLLLMIKVVVNNLIAKFKNRSAERDMVSFQEEQEIKATKIERYTTQIYQIRSIRSRKDLINIDKWADCYLVGSDQMWNPWMIRPQYLLDFAPKHSTVPKYSYATSFGVDNIPGSKKWLYKIYLSRFTKIAVREPRAAELIKEIINYEATVVLDPTFLLSQDEWREFSQESTICKKYELNNDYIICYFIGAPEFRHIETVKRIAKQLNLKIVLLPMQKKDFTESDVIIIADACAYDFVYLIDNARLVCTDSFHAVVFSFLMSTAFYYFPRFKAGDKHSQEARLLNVINKFKLDTSFWNDNLTISDIKRHMDCDYTQGYIVLEKEREKSNRILFDMIRAEKEERCYGEDSGEEKV